MTDANNPIAFDESDHNQTDSKVERNRLGRTIVALLTPIAAIWIGYQLGILFSVIFNTPLILGKLPGIGLGTFLGIWLFSKSVITNDAVMAFVTIDPVRTFMNWPDALITYGPGSHFSYWWERREGANTVNLSEASQSFTTTTQGPAGTFTSKYSVRLRPDITRLPQFLAGVAAVEGDLSGLITTKINQFLSKLSVKAALVSLPTINEQLIDDFRHGKEQGEQASDFEKRFGVIIGDTTVEEILPSAQIQETMNSQTESKVIDLIVAKSFGKTSVKALNAGIANSEYTRADVMKTRDRVMAMSGNLQGMNLTEQAFNLNVTGLENLSPELFASAAQIAQAAAAARSGIAKAKPTPKQSPKAS